ncbi:MAG: hypothetical protein JKY55_03900 [Aliivibrio sp.]|uniref:hypothetical protein n=1 Tax=Aliivibrio sp. TaxID=1872443 RepID=UPI001A4C4220|nr:hypothetical protein [Aliivibrio sp.]
MKYVVALCSLLLLSTTASAADTQCNSKKYHAYVDASLGWYNSLIELTVKKDPTLADVGQWFLEGRKHHFELNQAAVDFYLVNDSSHVALEKSVESWLQLDQKEIKALAEREDDLGEIAKTTFTDRQTKPHQQNYELRSAFADLLSDPKAIETPLNKYNDEISVISNAVCQ